jgi:Ras GTPase-activating-like protein IQGAP2/3
MQRRNLAAIANLITHVATQDFISVQDWFVRTPLQEYIRSDGIPFRDWVMEGVFYYLICRALLTRRSRFC